MQYLDNFYSTWAGLGYSVLVLLVFLSSTSGRKEWDYIASIAVGLFAVAFIGLRDRYAGTDTNAYVAYFDRASRSLSNAMEREPGFAFLSHLIGYVGDWQAFLVALIIVQLISVALASKLLGVATAFPLLLYISLLPGLDMLANGLRQGVGSTLGLLVWAAVWHRGLLGRLWLFSPVAFHKSMLILVPFVLFSRERYWLLSVLSTCVLIVLALLALYITLSSGDLYSFLAPSLELLTFAVVGSDLFFGEKLFGYVNPDEDIISPRLEIYFALIPLGALLVAIWGFLRGSYVGLAFERHRALFTFFALCLAPYALLFLTSYSYRFMYIAYPAAVLLLSFAYQNLRIVAFKLVATALVYASGVATYGSATFYSFRYSPM